MSPYLNQPFETLEQARDRIVNKAIERCNAEHMVMAPETRDLVRMALRLSEEIAYRKMAKR